MKNGLTVIAMLGLAAFVGCAEESSSTTAAPAKTSTAPSVDGSKFIITEEPEGAKDVIAVREAAKDGDDVVLVGRIGGSENPWIEGQAAFTVVDNSLQACNAIEGDTCKKPWDYCCETSKLPGATALVKVVDENGDSVKADARDLLHVTELSRIIVKGKAVRDDAGNLTVLATGIYVKK
ncbi:MAG TPA: hypothetical protein PK992_03730 [Planctomycetaceae bacterium]|nr:hypothetical protein [Planctomycetaceae bacterium]HRA87146.1 hypothetical protein [Planctomycetaceae bacterium]